VKRLAVFTDLHADVHALRDALVQIERLGCDAVVCAGDLVDYGCFPEETLRLLIEKNIPCIRGNHDRWATEDAKRFASTWDVSPTVMRFLRELPAYRSLVVEGVRVAVWHARPNSDMNGIYPDISEGEAATLLDQAACDVLVVGHTHVTFERRVGPRAIFNPGALLRAPAEPLDAPTLGRFGVVELPSMRFEVREAKTGDVVTPDRYDPPAAQRFDRTPGGTLWVPKKKAGSRRNAD